MIQAHAKIPDDAWEYKIRKENNDAAYNGLDYVPYCSTMPVQQKTENPKFMWVSIRSWRCGHFEIAFLPSLQLTAVTMPCRRRKAPTDNELFLAMAALAASGLAKLQQPNHELPDEWQR